MKKLFCLLLIAMMLIPAAFAETIDLSGLSLAELTELHQRVQLAMMETDEWQEVTVPQGVWEVGKDIPAGTWTVKCMPNQWTSISWGEQLEANGESIKPGTRYSRYNNVIHPTCKIYKEGDRTEYTFSVQNGDYIVIEHSSAIFTPFHGKPDLGFK